MAASGRLLIAKAARTALFPAWSWIAVRHDDLRRPERRDAVLGAVDVALGPAHRLSDATYESITTAALAA